jgi:hypothetical protein
MSAQTPVFPEEKRRLDSIMVPKAGLEPARPWVTTPSR